jgi:hypothetical protein
MTGKQNSPQPRRSNEDGSGTPLGTSVMVTVVMAPLAGFVAVNVPGPLKLGKAVKPMPPPFANSPIKHGPAEGGKVGSEQSVELPLRLTAIKEPKLDVLVTKVVKLVTVSWKVGKSNVTSRLPTDVTL